MVKLNLHLRTPRSATGQGILNFLVAGHWISTGIKLLPTEWDSKQKVVLKNCPYQAEANAEISYYYNKAQSFLVLQKAANIPFKKKNFIEFVFENAEFKSDPGFESLIKEYCEIHPLSFMRVKHYKTLIKDIRVLTRTLKLSEVDYKFTLQLRKYLLQKKNSENTITRKIRQVKAVVHYAQRTGLIKEDPLIGIKLKEQPGKKKFLTVEELRELEKLYEGETLPGNLQNVLKAFLFSCYTGLRFSDIIGLTAGQIKNNQVTIRQQKTDKPVTVPLIKKAVALIGKNIQNKCFETICNQPTNRYLKRIMQCAGINKEITYHCSRHTFATLSIYFGIPTDVVAELLGVNMNTVKVYAKIIEDVKMREMQKWEVAV